MVTVSYGDNVYVDIRALNGCDTDHLAVPPSIWKGLHSLMCDPNKAFSELEEKNVQLCLAHLGDTAVNNKNQSTDIYFD